MSISRGYSVARGTMWSAVDKFGIVLLQFVINIVLARMLTPDDFGVVAMIFIFVAVSQTLVDGGFAAALIQKIEPSPTDYSTIFFWNILFSATLYAVIFVAAPIVAEFFGVEHLAMLLRVLGVVVVINALTLVQRTTLRKKLDFKTIAIVDLLAYSISAAVAVLMAHRGCGAWSLVGMHLSIALLSTLLFWSLSSWRPVLAFSAKSLKSLFSYGGYLLIASIMQDVCTHIQGVVIGRKFSAAETGLYNQAKKMDEVASMTLPAVMCQVLFPVYSELQEDKRALSDVLSGNIRMISFVIFPIMMLLIIVARPLFEFLYGAQWLDAVPYFQLLCVGGFFSALYNFCYYAVAAVGRSKELFLWGCYKWGVLLVLLLVGASVSMRGVLVAMVVSNINIWLTNALLAQRYVGYGVTQQIRDIASALAMTLLCGGVVYWAYNDLELNWLLCVALFVAAYVALAWVCGVGALKEIRTFVVKYLKRRGDDRC